MRQINDKSKLIVVVLFPLPIVL